MPELPEVEVVCRGLNEIIPDKSTIQNIHFYRKNLRGLLPEQLVKDVIGQKMISIYRRAKYIFFELEDYFIVSHLGMSGSWRQGRRDRLHDHIEMVFSENLVITYNDPRRFGIFEILGRKEFKNDQRWKLLGPEPLSEDFTADYLWRHSRKKTTAVKTFIMDQRVVVGVGNIYAAEALFHAHVSPFVQAGKLKISDCEALVQAIRKVLAKAINKGGSSIHSFVSSNGRSGTFQNQHFVYGRAGEKCKICQKMIKVKVVSGRSSFWCVNCQKR